MIATIQASRGNFERETPKAYGINLGSETHIEWLPKSQVTIWQDESEPEYQRTYFIAMPIWLAKAKGLWGYNSFGHPICKLVENEQEIAQNLSPSWTIVDSPIRL